MHVLLDSEPHAGGGELSLVVVEGPDLTCPSGCLAAYASAPPTTPPCQGYSHKRENSFSETLWSPTSSSSSSFCSERSNSSSKSFPDEETLVDEHEFLETSTLLGCCGKSKKISDRIDIESHSLQFPQSPTFSTWSEASTGSFESLVVDYDDPDDDNMHKHATWRSYFAFTKASHGMVLVVAILSAIVSAAVLPISSVLLGKIFGEFVLFGRGEFDGPELLERVTNWILYYVILAGAGWIVYGIFYCSWIWFGELQAESARKRLYRALLAKELEWFDSTDHEITTVANRCHTQIREFQMAASQPLGLLLQCFFTACGALAIAFYHSWHLTLVCLAGLPVASLIVWFFSTRIERGIDQQSLAFGTAAQSISRAVKGIETVKYFNGQEFESNLYASAIRSAGLAYNRIAKHAALQNGFLRFITLMVFVQGFWYASTLVRPNTPLGELSGYMTTFWACLIAGQQIESILPLVILLEKGKVAASNLKRLSAPDFEHDIIDKSGHWPKTCNGFISFNDVKFTYPSRKDVPSLNGVTFYVNAGDTVFIVGKAGSGKSTLANLLLTVWRRNSGAIFIDDSPLESLDRDWVYDNVTYVPQRPAIFNETASHNIRFGTRDTDKLTVKDLREACDDVFLTEVLEALPQQTKTVLKSGGTNLSGGQRQRVSLARARLRNTPILILDEPGCGLDEGTKVLMMEKLRTWRHGKTTIIITHSLSDIKLDDFVYVMDKGMVVESGYRKDLETYRQSPFSNMLRESGVPEELPSPMSLYRESFLDYYVGIDQDFMAAKEGYDRFDIENGVSMLQSALARPNPRKEAERVAFAAPQRNATLPLPAVGRTMSRKVSRSRRKTRKARQSLDEVPPTPGSKQEHKNNRTFSHIFGTVSPHISLKDKFLLLVGLISSIITAAATPAFSYALARLLESFFSDFTGKRAMFWSIVIIGIAVLDGFAAALQLYCLEYVGQRWVDSVRTHAYRLVMKQARSWFDVDGNQIGRIAQDLEQNAEEMRNLLGRFVGFALSGVAILIIGASLSFMHDLELTGIGLVAVPVLLLVLRVFTWVSDKYEERSNNEAEKLGLFLQDVLGNLVTVRVLDLKDYFGRKHKALLRMAMSAGRKRAFFTGLTVGLSDTAVSLATALLFWYGARLIATKGLSLERAITVFTLLLFSLSNAAASLRIIPQVSSSKDAALRVLRLLELKETSHETQGSKWVELDGSLTVHNVSFSYPLQRKTPVLRNVSLQINPAECIALVGVSGAGKSTLVSLLERLYTPASGNIIFSGYRASDLDVEHLRQQVAIVPQHPYLFPASLKDNILYGIDRSNPADIPSIEQIAQVCMQAGLSEWIKTLKAGYDTLLSMGDSSVSGGQLQQIAIARALIRNPKILILDECTNSLDRDSANIVMETIYGLRHSLPPKSNSRHFGHTSQIAEPIHGKRGGPTIIMVTHKQEMMRMADRIVVMESGMVVDEGGFNNLTRTSDALLRVLRRQHEDQVDGDDAL